MSAREEVYQIIENRFGYVKRSGPNNVQVTCPFHTMGSVVTHTLAISLVNGLFFCFSCHEKGTFRNLLCKLGGSRDVVNRQYRFLLEELEEATPPDKSSVRPNVVTLEPLSESVLGLFDYTPLDLVKSGFNRETLSYFDVGFDKKNMRITFPLRDFRGRLEGISGRAVMPGQAPRYKLYDTEYLQWGLARREIVKSHILWNFHRVYPEVFFTNKSPPVVLVEGFKACMKLHQSGIRNTVALLGSMLTFEQEWLLTRMGCPIYLMLDNNDAGIKGSIDAAARLSLTTSVYFLPYLKQVEQPDDLSEFDIQSSYETPKPLINWVLENRKGKEFHVIRERSKRVEQAG